MPRKSRIDAPGALHHIIARGLDRQRIFEDDADRHNFLSRLGKILKETDTRCYAWAQIPIWVNVKTNGKMLIVYCNYMPIKFQRLAAAIEALSKRALKLAGVMISPVAGWCAAAVDGPVSGRCEGRRYFKKPTSVY
ncbi:hypothetical protein D1BOALGB6SA_4320 [Olavius sp. associated proteobacterium Delta 1]|nr:hypothetical protein D1BOALGB6SA_4320 [Olavius sp. associated proteobacterium Delta 1]